jgi:hypothetical protein
MTGPDDWQWFREHQDRAYRARLATFGELVRLQEHNGLDAAGLAHGLLRLLR